MAAVAAAIGGCAPTPTGDAAPPREDALEAPTPKSDLAQRYAAVEAAQRERLARLHYLDSRGVVELRYRDDSGDHFDQCDLRLFVVFPSKTALQLSKLGSRYAWIGSDEAHWWVFRLDKPKRLEVHSWESERSVADGGGKVAGFSVVSPRAILLLAGLSPLPGVAEVRLSADQDQLVAESTEAGTHARWTFDSATTLPTRVEIVDESGAVLVASELGDYETAPADNIAVGDSPKVPKRVVVTRSDGAGSVRMQLDQPSARAAAIKPHFFDLKDLQAAMQPETVTWRAPATTQAPVPQAEP